MYRLRTASHLELDNPEIAPVRSYAGFSLIISALLYLLLLILKIRRPHFPHLDLVLAVMQYGPILLSVLWFLRSQKNTSTEPTKLPGLKSFVIAGLFAVVAVSLSWLAVQGLVNPDESGYSFLARIYRSGRIMADPLIGATANVQDTPTELYFENHILRPFGWFPKFPPGWPLVLSLAYRISAPWLPSALFGTFQLLVIAAIGSRRFSQETGAFAVVLAALSPFYLISSVGMMSHALCALLAASAFFALCQGYTTGKQIYYAAMFACLAGTLQVRPYTGFVLTIVMTCAALWLSRSDRRQLLSIFGIGVVFGALAIAGVLSYNHEYSGGWLVSPYAEARGSNLPHELSLDPRVIWHGAVQYGPNMLLETLLGGFPFLHLLAAYAVVTEKKRRTEIWILASIYCGLVLAYLLHPGGYAVFFGERFHFEGFFALALLAARGVQLLVERWQPHRRAVAFAFAVLCCLQVGETVWAVHSVSSLGEPYRKVRVVLLDSKASRLVLLHDAPGFVAKHFNLNDADWRHAPQVYLVDADMDHRADWACRYGYAQWAVVSYNPRSHAATVSEDHTQCASAGNR
jgi:4-amino-4-deoxy-L-arabinose transferase-like glycosyltransferase